MNKPITFNEKELRTIYHLCKSVYCFGNLNQIEKEKDVLPLWNKLKEYFGYKKIKGVGLKCYNN